MSVSDRRRIDFEAQDIISAIERSSRLAAELGLPSMPPSAVRFVPERGSVAFDYVHGETSRTVAMNAEGIVALLIAHCIRLRLPLPRHAAKRLIVEATGVALQFDMRISDGAPEAIGAEPGTREPAAPRAMVWSRSDMHGR